MIICKHFPKEEYEICLENMKFIQIFIKLTLQVHKGRF